VLKQLQTRGFAAGESGNAPDGTKVIRAQVWADSRKNTAARMVAKHFGPTTKVLVNRDDIGIGIVVVLGDEFGKLATGPKAATAVGTTKICSPPVS
jgi:hypothetical protein